MYAGEELESSGVFAANITFLLCCMMYCAGLPILYPLAWLFFTFNYWVFKYLITKFFKKSTSFNEELAVYSIPYMKAGIFLHVITSIFFLSNPKVMFDQRDWDNEFFNYTYPKIS